jgi:hypothetical protein
MNPLLSGAQFHGEPKRLQDVNPSGPRWFFVAGRKPNVIVGMVSNSTLISRSFAAGGTVKVSDQAAATILQTVKKPMRRTSNGQMKENPMFNAEEFQA